MELHYPEIFNLARPYLQTRDNELHTKISYSFALKLLDAEGGNRLVILPAIILHDVGWKTIPEDLQLKAFGPRDSDKELNRKHEVEGARIAGEILEQVGYDPNLRDEIVSIILGHDSRNEPLSLNDAVVKDSDKLWRFSKEALEVDPKRFNIDQGVHAVWLGRQIAKWFFTETAKRLALEEQRARAISFGVPPRSEKTKM